MKNIPGNSNFGFTKWCVALIAAGWMGAAQAQAQVTLPHLEAGNYTAGTFLVSTNQTASGWANMNTGDSINIPSGNLSYTGFPASTGNKISFDGAGMDAAKQFTAQSSGTVYYSFLLNVTSLGSLSTTGGYFTSLASSTTSFAATLWLKASGSGYNIGVNPLTATANTVWSSTVLPVNTTVLVVVSYSFLAGTANDTVKLWINPQLGVAEPSALLSGTNTGTDQATLNRIIVRQDSATATPFIEMDELRIATSWADVTPAAVVAIAPGAPTIAEVTPGDGLLSVAFTPPSSDGGSVITNYQYSTDGINYVTRSPASTTSPLIISGLSNGTPYSVTLKAVNSVSAGSASTAASGTPVQPLTVPTVTPATITGKVGFVLSTNVQASSSPTSYAIATGTLPTGLSLDPSSGAITGTPSNAVTAQIVSVTASNVAGNSAPANLTFNISKGDQTITGLSTNSTKYTTDVPYALSAIASSGLVVGYQSSDTNVATISGSTVTIMGAGIATITASQGGDDNWNPATNVTQALTVTAPPASLTVTPSPMSGFNAALGSSSDVQTLNVVGLNLLNDVVISPVAGFEFSSDGINYVTNGLTLPKGNGGLTNDISVRIASNAPGGLLGGGITVGTATNGTNSLSRSTAVRGAVGVYWDFTTNSPATNAVPQDWTLGPVTQGNIFGSVNMLSSSSANALGAYTGASSGANAQIAAQVGALSLSNSAYFEIPIVVPDTDTNTLTDYGIQKIVFGSRATSTGPQKYTIRTSQDNYASDIASGSLGNNSTWAAYSNNNLGLILSRGTNTIRIYGSDGAGNASSSSANWRIDDLVMTLGSVINTNPTLSFLPGNIGGLKGFTGSPSPSTNYVVKGVNLTANLNLQVSTNAIQISTDNTTFTNQLTLNPATNGVLSNTVYVRLSSLAPLGSLTNGYVQNVSGSLTNNLSVAGAVYDAARGGSAATLAGWDVNDQIGGTNNFGPSPLAATIKNSDVLVGGMTRGSGVATSSTGAGRAWGGTTWENTNSVDAIGNGKFVTFTLQATSGKTLSLTSLPKFNYRAAETYGPTNGLIQYQVGSGAFQDVAQVTYTRSGSGTGQTLSPVNLSGIQDLQNVPASQQITFRIVNWGGQTNPNPAFPGSWYIFDTANTPDIDFEVTGSVNSLSTFDSWASGYGLSSGSDSAATTADPDGDGLNNAGEFAFGTSPVDGSSRAVTQSSVTGGIKITYLQRSGVTYTVKSATDLAVGFTGTVTPLKTTPQPIVPSGYEQYEATLTAPDRGFLKVEAVVP